MTSDATYMMDHRITVARMLHRMGRWDEALAALPPGATAERAEILVDRFWWRLDDAAEAEGAVDAVRPADPVLAGYLSAQVRYTRLLFGLEALPDDGPRARAGFTAATLDSRLGGWAAFWLGVLADNIDRDPGAAAAAYQRALAQAQGRGDVLLESYALRHIGAQLLAHDRDEGISWLRRSYYLRAALGARPQTAAAALTLADELPPGTDADQLREAARITARELELTWLLRAV